MKRLLLVLTTALLVSGCQSTEKICRDLATGKISGIDAYEKLGKPDMWPKAYCRQYMRGY